MLVPAPWGGLGRGDKIKMKKPILLLILSLVLSSLQAQFIPHHVSYNRVYDLLDELAADGFIEINTTVKPFSRAYIAEQLKSVVGNESLNKRQKEEVLFFIQEFAPEYRRLPEARFHIWKNDHSKAAIVPPAFHYADSNFTARITPLLGLQLSYNSKAANPLIDKRWFGAEFQTTIGKHLAVYGSLRDISVKGDTLTSYNYLNNLPGYEYKEATYGGDFSDSRGGIVLSDSWGAIGLVKDNPVWGDSYQSANILSGRTPSFPMITLKLQPVKWFELNYFHGWLISNVADSTNFYTDNTDKIYYRPANKFMAANMFTFTPVPKLKVSFGNSIIYAERNIQAGYLIPIAFYKSIDHLLTKGTGTENQNSQVYFNVSSRNIKHLHLFASVLFDEVSFSRFLPDNKEQNPMSLKIGGALSNFPLKNLTAVAEYTYTNIITYKHSFNTLTYTSNSYNLGHYLGDNSAEMYLALLYKPIRGLDLKLSFTDARKGNDFEYVRRAGNVNVIRQIISQPVLDNIVWHSTALNFNAQYEVFNNVFCNFGAAYSNIRAYDSTSAIVFETEKTAADYLRRFTNSYLHGKNLVVSAGVNFGF